MAEDNLIRGFLEKKLRFASVPRVVIERASTRTRVTIWTARPGIVIGRKGQELDSLRDSLNQVTGKDVRLEIQEIKKPDLVASLVAENVALQLERRIAFRRAMKKAVQTTMSMGAEGIRIQCAGRLAGADIARTEQQREGRCHCILFVKILTMDWSRQTPSMVLLASSAGFALRTKTKFSDASTYDLSCQSYFHHAQNFARFTKDGFGVLHLVATPLLSGNSEYSL